MHPHHADWTFIEIDGLPKAGSSGLYQVVDKKTYFAGFEREKNNVRPWTIEQEEERRRKEWRKKQKY